MERQSTSGAPPRSGKYGKRRASNDEADAERVGEDRYQENPEVPESGVARERAPEDDYGNGRAAEDDRMSRERSPKENADAEERKSHYSSQEKPADYGSRSPNARRPSGEYPEEEEERQPRRRGSRSGSANSRGHRSNKSSPMNRGRREDSRDRAEDGPFTQVYVTGYSRSSRRDDIERHFAAGKPDAINGVVMYSRFAFIDFKRTEDALVAVQLDGTEFEGRKLTVQRSYPKDGSKRRRRTTGPQQADECWECGKRGHWANDCENRGSGRRGGGDRGGGDRGGRRHSPRGDRRSRSPPRRYTRRSRSRSRDGQEHDDGRSRELREGRCFVCHQKGHIKRDCPEARGGRGDRGDRRDFGRGGDRGYNHRRSPSRSRSPQYRRRGGHDMGGRRPSPQRRHYSRSPQQRRHYSRSPQHEGGRYRGAGDRQPSRD